MKDLFSLKGKVIVITGGAGYLGSVIVKGLLEFEGTVVVADIAEYNRQNIKNTDGDNDKLFSMICDLSNTGSVSEMLGKVEERYGRIDVLINCAAYGGGAGNQSTVQREFVADEVWNGGMDGTVGVTYRCIREVCPHMAENGGSIINIASMYGVVSPDPGIYGTTGFNSPPMYGAGKAGVLQITRYYAAYLASMNIRVNAITPGPFPGGKVLEDTEFITKLRSKTMLDRIGKPEELIGAVLLLASDASSFMTGSNITVDGGWTAW